MLPPLKKYPRTRHLETSRFQHGDHDLEAVPFKEVQGRFMVVEEKIDGANCGVSFDDQANLLLQSRGHYLVGGPRERHFNLLKTWAAAHAEDLYLALGERYVMYGEWMYAKHTVFYDRLPHYFMEFDIYDRERDVYLSTARRRELLRGLKIASVAVLWEGRPPGCPTSPASSRRPCSRARVARQPGRRRDRRRRRPGPGLRRDRPPRRDGGALY
jgi:hypothetical protein